MTKLQQQKLIRAFVDTEWHKAQERIAALQDNPTHPTHAAMIEKNKGYITALEDVTEFILNMR